MVDIKDNQIGSIEEEFASLISLLLSTALLNGRLSKHFETNTGYDLNICLYYCQFDYCFLVMHWYLAASRLQSSRPMHRAILTRSCRADGKTLRVTFLDQDALITMFESNADGSGEFKLSMTQSDYEAEMNDQRKFLATMANGAAFEIDGEYYELVGGLIGNAGLTGYHLEFQIM